MSTTGRMALVLALGLGGSASIACKQKLPDRADGGAGAAPLDPAAAKAAYDEAVALQKQHAPAPDPAAVADAFQRSCDLGSAKGCATAADRYLSGPSKDPAKSRANLDRACTLEDFVSCGRLAILVEPTDKARAAGLYERACSAGDMASCANAIGVYLSKGSQVHDPEKAVAAAQHLCDKDASRCDRLAGILLTVDEIRHDEPRALGLYEKACSAKNGGACATQGLFVDAGRGVPSDPAKALALYRSGCERGSETACINAAFGQLTGFGGPADEASAVKALTKACDEGKVEIACYDLGLALLAGRGAPKDEAKGHAALERSGSRYPQVHLAHDLALGRHGYKVDLAKAAKYMSNACQGAYTGACADEKALGQPGAPTLQSKPDDEPMRWCLQATGTTLVNCHGDHGAAPKNGMQVFHSGG